MAALTGRKAFIGLLTAVIGAVFLVGALGCGGEAGARRGLRRVVHKEIKQFNKYHQREVKPYVYQSGGRFYRTFKERVDARQSMRRTNSLDTPYIASLSFTEDTYLTQRRATAAEAKRDVHFILSNSSKREIVYAYVGGLWKKKETY